MMNFDMGLIRLSAREIVSRTSETHAASRQFHAHHGICDRSAVRSASMPPPTSDTAALLTPSVRARVVEALPGARIRAIRPLGQGWGAAAFRVPSEDGTWVLRLPRPRSYWAMPDLEREVRLLPLIEARPLAVAVPRDARLVLDEQGSPIGALHRMVEGTPLADVHAPRGAARAALCEAIGQLLSVLHSTPVRQAKQHGARAVDLWTHNYLPMVEQALQVLPPASRSWLQQQVAAFEARGASSAAPRVLIHADISGDHLLVDDTGRLCGVIDFADALIADPALDFAGVLNHLGWRDLERVLAHYTGVIDDGAMERTRFYIRIAPIFQVTFGLDAVGPEERRAGIRRLAALAGAERRR
jgi:aminoglycoside phosphotransferase (APT) family kinase protein